MAINVSVQYNSGLLPDIILLTQCSKKNLNALRPSEHLPVRGGNVKTFRWDVTTRGTRLNVMKRFCLCSL